MERPRNGATGHAVHQGLLHRRRVVRPHVHVARKHGDRKQEKAECRGLEEPPGCEGGVELAEEQAETPCDFGDAGPVHVEAGAAWQVPEAPRALKKQAIVRTNWQVPVHVEAWGAWQVPDAPRALNYRQ